MLNTKKYKIHIEAHIDCNSRIGNLYKKIGHKQYELITKSYTKPSFSDFYMYDHMCFQWDIAHEKNNISLIYVDSSNQQYKKTIIANNNKTNYILGLKENWKTMHVTYDLIPFGET